jgi:hypothetical protein
LQRRSGATSEKPDYWDKDAGHKRQSVTAVGQKRADLDDEIVLCYHFELSETDWQKVVI